MKGQGKFYDGVHPLSYSVTFELMASDLVIKDMASGEEIVRWPQGETFRDEQQNVVIVLKTSSGPGRLEIAGIPAGVEKFGKNKLENNRDVSKILLLLGVIAASIALVWMSSPIISQMIARQIPFETEKRWSEKLKFSEVSGMDLCRPTEQALRSFKKLTARLYPIYPDEQSSDLEFTIVDSYLENAFAYPGGKIILTSQLLKNAGSPEEMAGVLAHEIAHVRQRHLMSMLIRSAIFAGMFHFVGGDFASVFALDPSTIMSVATLTFNRDMELEADKKAVERLKMINVSPEGFLKFFERVSKAGFELKILSTHPLTKERIQAIKSFKTTGSIPLLDEKEWSALKGYCASLDSQLKVPK